MKLKSLPKPAGIFLIAGLLIVAFTQLLAHFIPLPDFLRGALTGVGIALELVAFIKLATLRQKRASVLLKINNHTIT